MSKELMGAIVRNTKIEATYRVTVLGETSVKTKGAQDKEEFPLAVVEQGAALVKLCDDLTPEVGDVVGVQLYTSITDPDGGGVCVDLLFKDGGMHRVSNPPANIATARDAVKAAIEGAL